MQTDSKKAIVIGAGIVGVCTALELSKSNYNVTVIERFPLAAQFTSMANAGVVRQHVTPPFKSLSSRSVTSNMIAAFKSLLPTFKINYSTSIFMDPYFFADITSYKWLYTFFKSRFKNQDQDTMHQYEAFCFDAFKSNTTDIQNATGYDYKCNKGYTKIFPTISHSNNASNVYSALPHIQSTNVNSEETAEQSTIANLTIETYPYAFAADCHKFCNSIAQQKDNINFIFNTEAKEILVNEHNNVCGVTLDNNTTLKADTIVICAGIMTNNIIQNKVYQINNNVMQHIEHKRLKLPYIPIVPLQGFSISVPYSPRNVYNYGCSTMVYYPSTIYATRIADDVLRFTAYGYFRSIKDATKMWESMQYTVECKEGVQSNVNNVSKTEKSLLDNMDNCVKDNLLSLYDIDEEYFDEHKVRWTGFRPYTPDGLPIVDRVKSVNGLYVNAGHGLRGWTTSHGTAKLLRNLIDQTTDQDQSEKDILKYLSMDRF